MKEELDRVKEEVQEDLESAWGKPTVKAMVIGFGVLVAVLLVYSWVA